MNDPRKAPYRKRQRERYKIFGLPGLIEGVVLMELWLLGLLLLLALVSLLGWVSDSRDGTAWRPGEGDLRRISLPEKTHGDEIAQDTDPE